VSAPVRIQLSRRKGWRMPPNTVKVDRTTKWGNPFLVGPQGNAAECVWLFGLLLGGYHCLSYGTECGRRQDASFAAFKVEITAKYPTLRGKNLACWCRIGQPCHADLLLLLANRKRRPRLDMNVFLRRYGWTMEGGRAVRVEAG
jgi:hypothetical protein